MVDARLSGDRNVANGIEEAGAAAGKRDDDIDAARQIAARQLRIEAVRVSSLSIRCQS
jgi:hypothetical protein